MRVRARMCTQIMSGKPTLHYFDVNGRGEMCKLIAAVGGVEIDIVEYPFVANGASAADKVPSPFYSVISPKALPPHGTA